MKNLKIVYNGMVLFDGDVEEFQWSDSASGVTATGKAKRSNGSNGNFFDMLVGARKQQTENIMSDRRAELNAEKSSGVET